MIEVVVVMEVGVIVAAIVGSEVAVVKIAVYVLG